MRRRTLAVIEARMASVHLPGKVLRDLLGRPLLARLLDCVRESRRLDAVVVATTWRPEDDAVVRVAEAEGVPSLRGPEHDLLSRVTCVARLLGPRLLVRLPASQPFMDARLVDVLVDTLRRNRADYAGYRGLPDGARPEVMTAEALLAADRLAADPCDRTDATVFLRRRKDLFRAVWLAAPPRLARPSLDLAVRSEADLRFATALFRRAGRGGSPPSLTDVLQACSRDGRREDCSVGTGSVRSGSMG